MQRNNTKKTRSKQAPRLYKRTYKRKPKQSPTPTKKTPSWLDWFGFLLIPFFLLIVLGGK